ncbi:MAG: hypothetical protein ROM54_07490, partial [Anaerobiospirillum sp.]|nr:hypothetical protein [Anaerobiospirillum sp.]
LKVLNLKNPHRLSFLSIFKEPQSAGLWFLSAHHCVTTDAYFRDFLQRVNTFLKISSREV